MTEGLHSHPSERRGFGYLAVDAKRSGLPCRAAGCRRIFAVARCRRDDLTPLRAAIDIRNEHELREHGLIYASEQATRSRRRVGWSKR